MVTLSTSLLLLCLVGVSLANVEFFSGRSAPIIVQPTGEVAQDSVAYFKGMTTELNTLEDTRFFDLMAHVMGLPSVHVDADRTGFPSTSLFNKPKASVIIAIDSVGAATLKSFPSLSLFNSPKTSISSASYPISTASLLANLATGTTPSTHGIVGPSWRRANGELVLAYDADALPASANIADIIAQEFKGRSLIVSASASSSLSYAFAVHSDLMAENFGWNAHAYALSGDVFASKYEEQEFALFADELAALLKDVKVQVGDEIVTITADNTELLAEIAFVDNLIAKLKTNKLVKDDVPDMYTFVFSGLKGVAQKYGKDSTTFAAALTLVNNAAERLLTALDAIYGSRVASVVLAINPQTGVSDAVQEIVREKVSRLLYSAEDFAEQFPSVYVRHADFSGYAGDLVCGNLQNAISDSDATVQCFIPRVARAIMAVMDNTTGNNTGNSTDDSDYVWAFWLNFWITIFIAAFILWGAYCLVYVGMDAGKDSLLFRATGRHAHAN